MDRSMSVTSGGHALKPLSIGGSCSGSAGSAGISITFLTAHLPPSRYQVQIEDERFSRLITQLTKPYYLSPKSMVCTKVSGVPHSLVTRVSWQRGHQAS